MKLGGGAAGESGSLADRALQCCNQWGEVVADCVDDDLDIDPSSQTLPQRLLGGGAAEVLGG